METIKNTSGCVIRAARAIGLASFFAIASVPMAVAATVSPVAAPMQGKSSSELSAEALTATMAHLSEKIRALKDERDRILATPAVSLPSTDSHGHTLQEYVREGLLTPATIERLDRLLVATTASVKNNELQTAYRELVEAIELASSEARRYDAIAAYWNRFGRGQPDRSPYYEFLVANHIEPAHAVELKALRAKLDEQIEGRQFVEAMRTTLPALDDLDRRAAVDDAALMVAAVRRNSSIHFRGLKGHVECDDETSELSSREYPQIRSAPLAEDYYPSKSMRAHETGVVGVEVVVTDRGCPVLAYVTEESGFRRLDDAALKLAMASRFRPANQEGHAVASRLAYRVRFDIR